MADETPAAPAPAATPAPETAPAAALAPAAESAAPAPEAAPLSTPEAAPEAAKPEGADASKPEGDGVKPHTDEQTLLEEGDKKPDAERPGDKPEGEKPPEEAPKPIFEFQPYKLPEGVKLDDKGIAEFNTVLTDDKMTPQDRGQKLMDMYTEAMTNYDKQLRQQQHTAFAETRKAWRTLAMSDEVIGGSGHQTAMKSVASARDMFVPEGERKEFNDFLRITGAGDNPAFLRFLYRVDRKLAEPSPMPPGGKPPADIGKKPTGRRGALYDHPTSSQNRS